MKRLIPIAVFGLSALALAFARHAWTTTDSPHAQDTHVQPAEEIATADARAAEEIAAAIQVLSDDRQDITKRIRAVCSLYVGRTYGPETPKSWTAAKTAIPILFRILEEKKDYDLKLDSLGRSLPIGNAPLKDDLDGGKRRETSILTGAVPEAQTSNSGLQLRHDALYALNRIKDRETIPEFVKVLVKVLENITEGEEYLSISIGETLRELGPEARPAEPILLKLVQADSRTVEGYCVRINAAAALGEMGSPKAVPVLHRLAGSANPHADEPLGWLARTLRWQAASSLTNLYADEVHADLRRSQEKAFRSSQSSQGSDR